MRSTKGRVLCTEDDVDTRDLIDFVLTHYGYDVVCSAGNVQAIDLAKTQNFDLYLVDNWMPGLSGTELTEKLRQFDLRHPFCFTQELRTKPTGKQPASRVLRDTWLSRQTANS